MPTGSTLRSPCLPLALLLTVLAIAPAGAQEKLPPGTRVTRLEVHPTSITLTTAYQYSQLLVTGVLESAERIDLTRLAQIKPPAKVATVSPTGLVRPVADGSGKLAISYEGKTAAVPVKVAGLKNEYQVSFVRDVMPTLTRMGCNAGTCHGAAEGKNGFKLSLRGYDPLGDHRSLTDDLEGRRFNRVAPDMSLMLLKTSGSIAHVGGVLTQPGQPYYELLRHWIGQGVKLDMNSPRVSRIDILPRSVSVPLPGMKQQMAISATYTNGNVRDVTYEAFIESSNTEVATVDRNGTVTAVRRGEATILARYEGAYTASTLFVMGDRSNFVWKPVEGYGIIDSLVYEKLQQIKVLPSELATDAEFIRRVYLDLTGLPPQPEQVRAFLSDSRPSRAKREELVERLIGSPDFIEHWTNKWADLLQVNRKFLGDKGAASFRDWIRKAVADNMPYDKFVRSILTASGSNVDNPPASYFKILREPDAAMENTTQLFLAVRFNCNKCHDHPFERWTQDQYYNLAAYFAQVGRAEDQRYKGQKVGGSAVEGAKPLVEVISDGKSGEVTHVRTGSTSPPVFPYKHNDLASPNATRREQLAHWVTSKENVYFARSYVNRLWSYLLGVGLIEPVDDIRAGNPPSNPKLLDFLTEEFVRSGFNTQHMIRLICKSRTYQHSVVANEWNKDDETNYARALPRRLPAEVLYDAIHRVTGSVSKLPGLPPGSRAAQLLDSNVEVPGGFFNLFGKPPRESACECERSTTMMLGPVLNLVNGPVVAEAIRDPNNRIARLLQAEKDNTKVVEDLYLAVLCRPPTAAETEAALKILKAGEADFEELVAQAKRRQEALAAYEKQLNVRQAQWESAMKNAPVWVPVGIDKAVSKNGATLTTQPDGSVLASGANPANDIYTVTGKTSLKGITAIRLEVLPDPSLPAKGPGRAPNGNFVLTNFKVDAREAGTPGPGRGLSLSKGVATFAQEGFPAANALLGQATTGWAISPQFGKAHSAYFELREPVKTVKDTLLTFTLQSQFGKNHTIGKFRLYVTTTKPPLALPTLPENLAKILTTEPTKRTPQQKAALTQFFRSQDQELAQLQRAVAEQGMPVDRRQPGAQDLVWALLNSKAFLFNR